MTTLRGTNSESAGDSQQSD